MSTGLVRTCSYACIFKCSGSSSFFSFFASAAVTKKLPGGTVGFAVDVPEKGFIDLEKFVFVVRIENVFNEIVVEEVG